VIILDTNVLSEVIRDVPEKCVVEWMARQTSSMLFTTTITKAELFCGVYLLPDGRRKSGIKKAIEDIFEIDMSGRVLHFDEESARLYAEIASSRKKSGQPISQFDAMIAAITKSRGATLATRNVKDFTYCGISLVNPWRN